MYPSSILPGGCTGSSPASSSPRLPLALGQQNGSPEHGGTGPALRSSNYPGLETFQESHPVSLSPDPASPRLSPHKAI